MIANVSSENKFFLKRIVFLALPIMLQELISNSMILVSSIMIGSLGLYAITAVGLAGQVFFLFQLFVFGVNSGSSVFMGQFWGKGEVKNIHKTMGIAIIANLTVALSFAMVAILLPKQVMAFFSDGNPEVMRLGASYLRMVCMSYFMVAITETFKFSLRSIGQTKIPMVSTGIALTCNAVLCYVLIKRYNMGIEAAAISTVVARTIDVIIQVSLVFGMRMPIVTTIKKYFTADRKFIREYLKITTPVILNEMLWALGTVIYTYSYKFTGTEGQGAIQIAGNLNNLFMVLGMSLGSACGIMIANTLGSGDTALAIRYARKCMILVFGISIFMAASGLLFAPHIIDIYDVSELVKSHANKIIKVIACMMTVKALNYTMIVGILRSGGDTKFCLVIDTASVWFVGIPLSLLASRFFGFPVYIVAMFVYSEEIFKFIFAIKRTISNVWARNIVDNM